MKLFKTYSTLIFVLVCFVYESKSTAESDQFHDALDSSTDPENQEFYDALDEEVNKTPIIYKPSDDKLKEPTENMGEVYKNYTSKYEQCMGDMTYVYGTSKNHANELMAYSISFLKHNHKQLLEKKYAKTFFDSIGPLMIFDNLLDRKFFCNQKENVTKCNEEMEMQNEFKADDKNSIVTYAVQEISVKDYVGVMHLPYVAEFISTINVATKLEREIPSVVDHCNSVCRTKEETELCLKEIKESKIQNIEEPNGQRQTKTDILKNIVYNISIEADTNSKTKSYLFSYIHSLTQFVYNSGEIKINLPNSTKFCRIQAGIREINNIAINRISYIK